MQGDQSQARTICISHGWWERNPSHRLFSLVHAPVEEAFGSVLILPPFGLKASDLFMPAFYTASAGALAIRFDGRNNVGFSEGEICDFKLSVLIEDARFAAERLVRISGTDDFIIYGMSLTASIALILARDFPRARVVLFVPVVDLCGTIDRAAENDSVIDIYRRRSEHSAKVQKIFGHDVNGQPFYDDLVATELGTVDGVLSAARAVRGRVDLVLAENDQFSSPLDRHNLIAALDAQDRTLVLEATTHDFGRSPVTRKRAFGRLVDIAQAHFDVPEARRRVGLPPDSDMVAAARAERGALQAIAGARGLAA